MPIRRNVTVIAMVVAFIGAGLTAGLGHGLAWSGVAAQGFQETCLLMMVLMALEWVFCQIALEVVRRRRHIPWRAMLPGNPRRALRYMGLGATSLVLDITGNVWPSLQMQAHGQGVGAITLINTMPPFWLALFRGVWQERVATLFQFFGVWLGTGGVGSLDLPYFPIAVAVVSTICMAGYLVWLQRTFDSEKRRLAKYGDIFVALMVVNLLFLSQFVLYGLIMLGTVVAEGPPQLNGKVDAKHWWGIAAVLLGAALGPLLRLPAVLIGNLIAVSVMVTTAWATTNLLWNYVFQRLVPTPTQWVGVGFLVAVTVWLGMWRYRKEETTRTTR